MKSRSRIFIAAAALALGLPWMWKEITRNLHPRGTNDHPAPSLSAPGIAQPPPATFSSVVGDNFTLSLDHIAELLPGGGIRYHRIDPPATAERLLSRLKELADDRRFLPVCYRTGQPRTPENRRFVTRDLTLKLSGEHLPPPPYGIVWKERPNHAPGHIIASAQNPVAAIAALESLRALPGIEFAEVQLAVQRLPRSMPTDPLVASQWHLKYQNQPGAVPGSDLNIEDAWGYGTTGGVRGAGIRIGIVDDGLQLDHPDLAANIDSSRHWDWNDDDDDPSPSDRDIHGTPCAGNAAAAAQNGIGGSGTAPEATLVGLRLISAPSTDAQEAAAFSHLAGDIHIKSNSWGPGDNAYHLDGPGPLGRAALAHAAATGRDGLGTIFVWAAGNGLENRDNSNYDGYANDIHTIAVAATDSQLNQAHYSEPGANILVAAPSDGRFTSGIITTDLTGSRGYNTNTSSDGGDYHDDFGGTSSSTPLVAGIVALMLEKNPDLGWRDVQEILIRTAARIQPADIGWAENSAGLRFSHKFGAGLADASAAVALASAWSPLPAATRLESAHTGLSIPIPDNNPAGAELRFTVAPENLRCEHVQLTLTTAHTRRGDLEITLTSPSGMTSRLATQHNSSTASYSDWTFSSVHHWGEQAAGIWTLRVADSRAGVSGTLSSATLILHGTPLDPVNPPPVVAITSPAAGRIFGPGESISVTVEASDLNIDLSTGTVTSVRLMNHGALVAESTSAPYVFHLSPDIGNLLLTAVATDAEGLAGTSLPVPISVANRPPVVTGAAISPPSPAFADQELSVGPVSASDPDLDPLSFTWSWEYSADGMRWTASHESGASLPPEASRAGRLWRCVITASDGSSSSAPFATAPVNVLARAPSGVRGSHFSHTPGLLLPGSTTPFSRQVIINEISQGSTPSSGWIELLTLKPGSLAGWKLANGAGDLLVFSDAPPWNDLPAGTLIVIHRGDAKDPLLPAGNTDSSSGPIIAAHDVPELFNGPWPSFGNPSGSLVLLDPSGTPVAGISHGGSPPTIGPTLPSIPSGSAAYYAGRGESDLASPDSWHLTTSAGARRQRSPRAGTNLFFSEYVEGGANNRALEIHNPGPVSINLAEDNYWLEIYEDGSTSLSAFIRPGGSVSPGGVFVIKHPAASAGIVAQDTSPSLSFNGNDAILLRKNGDIVDSIGRVGGDPGSAWTSGGVTTANSILRRKPSITTGDPDAEDPFDPSLEWTAHPPDDFSGLGWHATDSGSRTLGVAVIPSVVSETAGALASTGNLSLPSVAEHDTSISLESSRPGTVVVPAEVPVPAGADHVTFSIAVIDDAAVSGTREAVITASSPLFGTASATLAVTDDEAALDGVTPGSGNTPGNVEWIADIRAGYPDRTARYQLAEGASLPEGLILDPSTGAISGIIASAPGSYPVLIEIINDSGESAFHGFTLEVADPPDYAAWIALHDIADASPGADPDGDGHANLVEYYLAGDPSYPSPGLGPILSVHNGQVEISFWRRTGIHGVSATLEWSTGLSDTGWHPLDTSPEVILTESWREFLQFTPPISPGGRRFYRLRIESP